MDFLRLYYDEALKVFYEAGGSEEELYWLVSSMLVRYPAYKEELEIRRKLMDLIVQEAKGRILDAGCSLGILTFRMALKDKVEWVIGIDKSQELVDFCNRLRDGITKKTEFLHEDFLKVKFEEEFDCIVFLYTLHDYEPKPFLEKALGVLSQDGKIIIGDFDINGLRGKIRTFAQKNELEIIKDITIGKAKTHGDIYEAFLMIIEGD